MFKAWKVTAKRWPKYQGIWRAETCGKAKSLLLHLINESGYDDPFTEMTAVRAPEFDALARTSPQLNCLGWRDGIDGHGCLEVNNQKEK